MVFSEEAADEVVLLLVGLGSSNFLNQENVNAWLLISVGKC